MATGVSNNHLRLSARSPHRICSACLNKGNVRKGSEINAAFEFPGTAIALSRFISAERRILIT